ncbi:hypothetical protein ACFQU3_19775 [Terrabacter sp. GCM10028922]|uniref:hypothetical protein n=1 Tax=Terrabacter sp. GCM10028922 TaxID=3273428 RepID=UPI003617A7E4
MQDSLFSISGELITDTTATAARHRRLLRVLITVTAAPNPSASHGETVCVAGLEVGVARTNWIRLYPVNLRHLGEGARFRKYDVIEVEATPATADSRNESWKPDLTTMKVVSRHKRPWDRRAWIDPMIEPSMCALLSAVATSPTAQSLALIRPAAIVGLDIEDHPGWSRDEQLKIDAYVNQFELFDAAEKTPLEAPRFKAWYLYRCSDPACQGRHRQGVLDWELVAYQRRLGRASDAKLRRAIHGQFFGMICDGRKDTCFYVGNQAKHRNTFSVIGMYYPPRG